MTNRASVTVQTDADNSIKDGDLPSIMPSALSQNVLLLLNDCSVRKFGKVVQPITPRRSNLIPSNSSDQLLANGSVNLLYESLEAIFNKPPVSAVFITVVYELPARRKITLEAVESEIRSRVLIPRTVWGK